jgi:VWFA-related protein
MSGGFLVMQGALSLVLAFLLMGGAQQPQSQQQSIPDAPTPQNSGLDNLKNQVAPGKSTTPDSTAGPAAPAPSPAPQAPSAAPPPAAQSDEQQEPPEILGNGQGPMKIVVPVNYVDVPVTVRDSKHQLVAGLTWRQFRVFEDGVPQRIVTFSVDPAPLSVAFVIDQSLPQDTMKKVNDSLAAVAGAFTPSDAVAVYTYNNGPSKVTDFTAAGGQRLPIVLDRAKKPGREMGVPVNSGPLATGPIINGQSVDPNLDRGNAGGGFITIPKEVHTLNDAILFAAKDLAQQPRGRRRVIYVVSDGKEAGSKASYREVVRFQLANEISVYGTLVGDSATWGLGYLDKIRLPLIGPTNDILPKYAFATGGSLDAEFSLNGIQRSFAKITEAARFQYTIGYISHQPIIAEKYHKIEVRVVGVAGLDVTARDGYYPSASNRR